MKNLIKGILFIISFMMFLLAISDTESDFIWIMTKIIPLIYFIALDVISKRVTL